MDYQEARRLQTQKQKEGLMASDDTRQIYEMTFGHAIAGHTEIVEAMSLCLLAHRDQWRRRHQVMYALHPFRMLALAEKLFIVPTYVKSAILLHDVFEDSHITAEEALKAGISDIAVGIASELTRRPVDNENTEERRRIRLEELLLKAQGMSNEARFIKALDRIDNLADGFISFSRPKMWHYTKEAVKLHKALLCGMPSNSFTLDTQKALGYLRDTINAVIKASIDRGQSKFKNFDLL